MPSYRFLFRLESARRDQLSDIPKNISEGLSLASYESEYRARVMPGADNVRLRAFKRSPLPSVSSAYWH